MSSKSQNSFFFAVVLCLIVSFSLALTANGLKNRQEINVKIDKQKNILKALGLISSSKKYSNEQLSNIYSTSVKNSFIDRISGAIVDNNNSKNALPIFLVEKEGDVDKYAFTFKAYGLWSWIHGVIALKGDGKTIVGFTVFDHKETPGLGGEVEKKWFQDQFINKKIVDINNNFTSIQIAKGKAKDTYNESELSYSIDGMSGATITSKGLERDLKTNIKQYEVFSKKLREG